MFIASCCCLIVVILIVCVFTGAFSGSSSSSGAKVYVAPAAKSTTAIETIEIPETTKALRLYEKVMFVYKKLV